MSADDLVTSILITCYLTRTYSRLQLEHLLPQSKHVLLQLELFVTVCYANFEFQLDLRITSTSALYRNSLGPPHELLTRTTCYPNRRAGGCVPHWQALSQAGQGAGRWQGAGGRLALQVARHGPVADPHHWHDDLLRDDVGGRGPAGTGRQRDLCYARCNQKACCLDVAMAVLN